MSKPEEPTNPRESTPATLDQPSPRKLRRGRRLLIATIGAATVNYAASCGEDIGTMVANLMAPPFIPTSEPSAGTGSPPPTPNPPLPLDSDAGTDALTDAAASGAGIDLGHNP